ncbi:hypothetical protein G3485_20260 [Shewanella baltica]|uniref:hypothetical protein n=1 Tax=Shewanella baltica TaxID=62322 RepID=UPI00217D472E|nr:hypothetical protein [Shewanella baltica]MCS6129389.1 hypothetical protein [Shewanella baltica]MCS6141372.1 hypothetical protein [Shewanella baltica]MCS6147657.1 hypothetical protein [Shewanella baltica]MCS6172254.1 hypothetical protein [Shewanella baltica]MCS6189410.1 hypothetical protein [Shewanella baltica]
MTIHQFDIFADYFQLYLMDDEADDNTSEIWTDEALDIKLAIAKNTVAVGTYRNIDVKFELEVLESEPKVDLNEWDHASLGFVSFPSGKCAVYGCTDYLPDATRIELPKGNYALLSLAKGLDSITVEWEPADDLYKVILWPSDSKDCKPLKLLEIT